MRNFEFYDKQAIISCNGEMCKTASELLSSELFKEVLTRYLDELRTKTSNLLKIFPAEKDKEIRRSEENIKEHDAAQDKRILELLQKLSEMPKEDVKINYPHLAKFFDDCDMLQQFIENLYNYWRRYERFLICYAEQDSQTSIDKKPWTTFNNTIECLNHLVRKVYRDIIFNITNEKLSVYRQMPAGSQVAIIATKKDWEYGTYENLKDVKFIRQILIEPPLILDPPYNKRSGMFKRVDSNPIENLKLNCDDWLCFPAKVGELVIHLFFHKQFIGLGASVINLFDLVEDSEVKKKPDAIYLYGVPEEDMQRYKDNQTVFFEDDENDIMVAAIPLNDKFGYFGYIKKMMLTLHNAMMMKKGRMPVHGAMVKIEMNNGINANVIIMGDTGAGKSESLEAFRVIGEKYLREMTIIFDDMGSLEISDENKNGKKDEVIKAYGTETGAFVRLDDLQPGYTLVNIDRSIIMSPHKINARAVLPITTLKEVLHGYKIDYFLYANNYEQVDNEHPFLEKFDDVEKAIGVFRAGKRMAKGTTTETGLVAAYFANVFGPAQYQELHEKIAKRYFDAIFKKGVFVGQLRTRLGIPGYETKGPEEAAEALFKVILKGR